MSVVAVCRKVGMSRQNYYARRRARQRQKVDADLVVRLAVAERQLQPRLGGRKLHVLLEPARRKAGIKLGRDRLFEVLRERELLVPPRVAERPATTNSYHCLPVFRNEVKDRVVDGPNQVWVSDLTYLRTQEGFLYLALITDRWSRKVVGHHCGESLETIGALKALDRALEELPAGARPIHHSDRGSQYCSHEYVKRLRERQLGISMTELDHCAENALAERVNGILKSEYGLGQEHRTKGQALCAVEQAIYLYNTRRPHTALGYQVPAVVHQQN